MTVHPHGCGEQYIDVALAQLITGSSPRVWGTAARLHQRVVEPRFIPTGVGNSVSGKPA